MITTRERIDEARKLRVTALKEADALTLIQLAGNHSNISLSEEQQQRLFRRTGGIPLVITLTMARLAANARITDNNNNILDRILADYGKVQKDLVVYCLQSSIDSLHSENAQTVLMVLSVFAKDASCEALQFVAGFADDPLSFEEALFRLEQLSLVDVNEGDNGQRYSLLPITRDFALKGVGEQPQQKQMLIERQLEYYLNKLAEIGYDYTPSNWSDLKKLDNERENLFTLMSYLDDGEKWRDLIRVVTCLYGYLSFRGHWSDYLKWVERTEFAANALLDSNQYDIEFQQSLGLCLKEKCWIQINLGQLDEAKETIGRALTLFEKIGYENGKATALRHLGLIEWSKQEYRLASDYYLQALNIWQELGNEREVASIYNNLGSLALQEGDFSRAESELLTDFTQLQI